MSCTGMLPCPGMKGSSLPIHHQGAAWTTGTCKPCGCEMRSRTFDLQQPIPRHQTILHTWSTPPMNHTCIHTLISLSLQTITNVIKRTRRITKAGHKKANFLKSKGRWIAYQEPSSFWMLSMYLRAREMDETISWVRWWGYFFWKAASACKQADVHSTYLWK